MADEYDLAVIGAGPAGSITAYCAARRGLRTALVDQREFPRDKACGDGLGPGVANLLRQVGLEHVLAGEVAADALTVYGPDGSALDAALPAIGGDLLDGYVVPRAEFDQRLRSAALEAGAVDLAGHKLLDTGPASGHRWATLRRGDETVHLRASLVVGADGAYSTVRRLLGVPRNRQRHMAIAMRAYAKTDAFDPGGALGPRMVFEFSRALLPAYGWIFPTGRGLVNVGVGLPVAHVRRPGYDLRTLLDSFVDGCRARGIDVGTPYRHRAHHLPTAGAMPRLVHERAVLVGDAASMINPFSGEGIAYAMSAAHRLVEALPTDLSRGLDGGLREYERQFRRAHRAHVASVVVAARLLASPWCATRVIRAARRDPRVLGDAVEMLFGLGRFRASTALRILRSGR
jgi:geranylgeranyl reductase family protein